jgi:PAT family beta-lactamase induction signal transducer AmpG
MSATKKTTGDVLRALRRPKVLAMLLLGFSSGLPLYLVGNTMGYWMRENGSELSAIGFLSWVGLAYTLKFLWAPIIDKTDVPLLGRLGHRRGWMLLSQLVVALGLAGMAIVQPQGGLVVFGALALVAAFASATQDIVIDAWRIEIADDAEELGLLTSGTQFGYRTALLVTDALILILATYVGWALSYWAMVALMGVGLFAALFLAREPAASQRPEVTAHAPLWTVSGLWDAIAGPFLAFFKTHGKWALLMLAAISLYRLPDFVMGPMSNPFYADIGISKAFVGEVRASIGLATALLGIAAAGISAVRFGFVPTLLAGAILGPGSNAAFAWVAHAGGDHTVFAAAMAIDGFATGFAGTALVAYMSSLTSIGYTATQYALLSSFYALLGKLLKGFSGVAVEQLAVGRTLVEGYALFFLGTALAGLPALLLCLWLARRIRPAPAAPLAGDGATG